MVIDIKAMAVEAGFTPQRDEWVFNEMLERFAQAVARECCKIVDSEMDKADCALMTAPSDAIKSRFGLEG